MGVFNDIARSVVNFSTFRGASKAVDAVSSLRHDIAEQVNGGAKQVARGLVDFCTLRGFSSFSNSFSSENSTHKSLNRAEIFINSMADAKMRTKPTNFCDPNTAEGREQRMDVLLQDFVNEAAKGIF